MASCVHADVSASLSVQQQRCFQPTAVLQPTKVYSPNESIPKTTCQVSNSSPVLFNGHHGALYEIPFSESGTIDLSVENSQGTGDIWYDCGTKEELNDKWEAKLPMRKDEQHLLTDSGVTGKKCYFAVYGKSGSFNATFDLKVRLYPSADRAISISKKEYFGFNPNAKSQSYKFTAEETGTIKVSLYAGENDVKFSLLNSKKQQISRSVLKMYDIDSPVYFGVKKGKTYYLRLKNLGPADDRPFWLSVKNTKIKEKSGATRKKAVTVKRNKKVRGYVLSGKKGHDWYKVKVKKSGKVKFYLQNQMTNQCYLDVYNKKGKKVKGLKYKKGETDNYILSKTKYGRLSKGTYYVKVYTKDKRECGGYALKWK